MSEAGWHPDPSGQFRLRWWDGTAWTAHAIDHAGARVVQMPAVPSTFAGAAWASVPAPTMTASRTKPWVIAMLVATGLLAMSAFLPWATFGIFSKAGTDGDGRFTLGGAVVAGILAGVAISKREVVLPAAIIAMLVGAGSGVVALVDIDDVNSSPIDIGIGIGLIGTLMAGIGLLVTGIGALVAQRE
jgi:hypothetical protein